MIEGRSAHALAARLPQVADRQALEKTLVRFWTTLLREVSDPAVTALFRLPVIEAERARRRRAQGKPQRRSSPFWDARRTRSDRGCQPGDRSRAIPSAALGRSADEPRDTPRRGAGAGSDRSAGADRRERGSDPLSLAFGLKRGAMPIRVRPKQNRNSSNAGRRASCE
jgi:hypothetical protein